MADENKMVVFGGYAIDGMFEHSDMWYFNLQANQWRRLPATFDLPCPAGRHEHTLAKWVDANGQTFAVLFGGLGISGVLHDLWITNITDILATNDFDTSSSAAHSRAHFRHVSV
jgi:hypothetical protein